MANPLFNRFGQNGSNFIPGNQAQQGPLGNMMGLMGKFQQFRNTFRGDPRAQVQQLLESGQMTQEQFNQLSQMAQQFQNMIKR